MDVLFVAVLLFVGATARPNGPPNGGGRFPSGPNGGGRFPNGPNGGGFPSGPNGGGRFPNGPNGGGFPNGPNGGGNFPFGPNGGGNFPFGPNGGGNFPSGPNGGGNFPFGPNGGGNFPSGPAPSQLNTWYSDGQVGDWDAQGELDSEDQEGQDLNGQGFGPADFSAPRYPRHGGPHGGRRPPFRPGGPNRPPHHPDGGRPFQPNITFTPLFRIDNVTAQNISASVPLKQGENVFLLPPGGNRPPQPGYGPPVPPTPQPYFKIIYNQNATQKISFEFGVAQIVGPAFLRGHSESDEYLLQ